MKKSGFNKIRQTIFSAILPLIFLTTTYAAGVSLSGVPTSQTVTAGQTTTYTIKINRDGFADKVTLSATNLPNGATAGFSPNTTTAASSILTVKTLTTTPVGTFNFTVKGTANGITIAPITVKLTVKPLSSVSVNSFPESQSIIAGQETFYDIVLNRTNFDDELTFSAEDLPSGVSVYFEPKTTTGNTTRMRLYSNGLPPFAQEFSINVKALDRLGGLRGIKVVKVKVNCDIMWSAQGFPEFSGNAEFATAVTSDSLGNVYIAGHKIDPANNFSFEVWVAKYSAQGTRIWLSTLSIPNVAGLEKYAKSIGVDSSGNVFVAGYTKIISAVVDYDAFVAKFDSGGTQLNNVAIFGSGRGIEDGSGGMEISFNSGGNPVLNAALNIRRQYVSDPISGEFEYAFFDVAQSILNPNLTSRTTVTLRSDLQGDPKDLTVGSDGSIYVVGRDFNFTTLEYFGWLYKIFPNGTFGRHFYVSPDYLTGSFPTKVAADLNGNAFVSGTVSRNVGGNTSVDAWLSKHNSASTLARQWINFESSTADDLIGDLVTDASGSVIYTGKTAGNLSAMNPSSETDGWLGKRAGDGTPIFLRQFAVTNKDGFDAITLDAQGNALLAGHTVVFNNVNYGIEDSLLVKFSLTGTSIFSPAITNNPVTARGGSTITINGVNLNLAQGFFFNGQPLIVNSVSPTAVTVTLPSTTSPITGNLSVTRDCNIYVSGMPLTITP